MGLGITNVLQLEAEKELMKPAIGAALKSFYATIADTPITGDEYADKFAEVLVDTMFDRIITYISVNANVVVSSGITACGAGPGTIASGVGTIT
tara:strand:- start:154 stop:435 length:282 start_codon:yes stop_codon:yes gene_type:complete